MNCIRLLAAAAIGFAAVAQGQSLPRTQVKGVGELSAIINSSKLELPFWRDTIPQASGGMVTGDIVPFDQLGLDNAAVLRLLKQGGMDFGTTDLSRLAADDPRFEGCDLAGIALDIDKVRAACNAYRPVLDRLMQQNWNARLMYIGLAQQQVFWCKPTISTLADLKGKKVRVFNKTMIDFLGGVGATGVSMPFPEVIPSLQLGVIDCAVTGTLSGNTGGWPEVTTNIYPLSLGWAVRFTAVNLDSWKRSTRGCSSSSSISSRSSRTRCGRRWPKAADATPASNPADGKTAKLTIVPVKQEDMSEHKQVEGAVLANWAQRCGANDQGVERHGRQGVGVGREVND